MATRFSSRAPLKTPVPLRPLLCDEREHTPRCRAWPLPILARPLKKNELLEVPLLTFLRMRMYLKLRFMRE
jgi:hypothetical protein